MIASCVDSFARHEIKPKECLRLSLIRWGAELHSIQYYSLHKCLDQLWWKIYHLAPIIQCNETARYWTELLLHITNEGYKRVPNIFGEMLDLALFGCDTENRAGKQEIQLRAGAKFHVSMALRCGIENIVHNVINWPAQKPQAGRKEPIECIAVSRQVIDSKGSVPWQILSNIFIIVSLNVSIMRLHEV